MMNFFFSPASPVTRGLTLSSVLSARGVGSILVAASLGLAACDNSGGDAGPVPTMIASQAGLPGTSGAVVQSDGSVDATSRASLNTDSRELCHEVGESFDISVLMRPASPMGSTEAHYVDVSSRVRTSIPDDDALDVVAQGDDVLSLRFSEPDIAELRLELDNPTEVNGLTLYLAGFTPDMPRTVLLKQPIFGGCAYALRLPDVDFCRATWVRHADGVRPPRELGSAGIMATLDGCDYTVPDGVAVVELPAEPGADFGIR